MSEPRFLHVARVGDRPRTTPTNPHTQLTQNAPAPLQARVFEHARALPGVVVGASYVSVPGTRAFHLPTSRATERSAFLVEREFAHLHPVTDGSLHLVLPPSHVATLLENGWGERHPLAGRHGLPDNIVMVFGPRDEAELAIVCGIVDTSHAWATGS